MKLIAATTLLLSISTVSGFVAPSQSTKAFMNKSANPAFTNEKINTGLSLSPSDIDFQSLDVEATSAALQHIIHSTSTILSDAAAATADVATDAKADAGWWQNYLQLYKSLLLGVHSTIDQPLRDAGWDQTWGVSIAVFTASEYHIVLFASIDRMGLWVGRIEYIRHSDSEESFI
jgi:hypothetical protein